MITELGELFAEAAGSNEEPYALTSEQAKPFMDKFDKCYKSFAQTMHKDLASFYAVGARWGRSCAPSRLLSRPRPWL